MDQNTENSLRQRDAQTGAVGVATLMFMHHPQAAVHWFPMAATAKCRKRGGIRGQIYLLQFWRLEARNQAVSRAALPQKPPANLP